MPFPHITKDNARQMAALAYHARKAKAANDDPMADPYRGRRLARVRGQLDLLDARISNVVASMTAKPDPAAPVSLSALSKELKELVDAQTRLSEQERVLDGRPAPGQLRPTSARSAPRPSGGLAPRAAGPAPGAPPDSGSVPPAPPAE